MYLSNLKYFLNLRILKESENTSECELEAYINHLDKLGEVFKIGFGDFDNMHVLELLATPFDMKIDNKGCESDLEDELIEMHVDLEAKAFFKSQNLSEYWSNINTATEYPKLFCVLPVAVTGSPNLLCCILRYFIDFAFCCCAI